MERLGARRYKEVEDRNMNRKDTRPGVVEESNKRREEH